MISPAVDSSSLFPSLLPNCTDKVPNLSIKEKFVEKRKISSLVKVESTNGDLSFESQHSFGDDSTSGRKFRRKSSRPQKVTTTPAPDIHTEHQELHQELHHHQNQAAKLNQSCSVPNMLALPAPHQVDNGLATSASATATTTAAAALGLCETCGSPLASVRGGRPGVCDVIVLCVDCTCDKISLLLEESDSCERSVVSAEVADGEAASGSGSGGAAYVCRLCQPPRLFAASADFLEHYACEHESSSRKTSSGLADQADDAGSSQEVGGSGDADAGEGATDAHRCSHCGLGLRSEDDVEQHERFHLECEFDDATKLRCYYCCKEFAELDALNAHQRAHSTERPHHCGVCDRAFSFACTLQRHMLVHQAYHSTYTCHYCDQTFSDAGQLDRHFDVCEWNMDDAAGLAAGDDGSKLGAPNRFLPYSHTCSTCGKSFRLAWRYKLHMRAACNTADKYNADSDRTCSICKKMFANPMNLHRHELIHAGIRNYQCKLCGKAFVQKTQLETHMNIHNGIKPFQCEVCNKNFTDRSTFHKHKKIHGKPKAFPCAVCGKVFNQAGYLKLHAKVHGPGGNGGTAVGGVVEVVAPVQQQQQQHQASVDETLTYCNLDMPIKIGPM